MKKTFETIYYLYMDIIEKIYRTRLLREIINNVNKNYNEGNENLHDLEQDLYLELMGKRDLLEELDEKGHLKYYLSRMVCSNIGSKTSRYYYKYKKHLSMVDDYDFDKERKRFDR